MISLFIQYCYIYIYILIVKFYFYLLNNNSYSYKNSENKLILIDEIFKKLSHNKYKNISIYYTKQRIYRCYNILKNPLGLIYYYLNFKSYNVIRVGEKMINSNNKIKLSEQYNKLLNDTYRIIFVVDVYFNQYGSIITLTNSFISLKGGCRCNKEISDANYNYNCKRYNTIVFQITQYLGSAIYHSIINCLTKIVPIYNTLIYYSASKIHIHKNSAIINYLKLLKFNEDRIISGNFYASKAVIMERVDCASSIYTFSLIQLRNMLRKSSHVISSSNYPVKLLIIKRLYSRKINNFQEVINSLCLFRYNFTCNIYFPNTPFRKMIEMFYTADIIVGPHGAGFTNMIVSKENVKIFEIIKASKPVLCFATLANILGYKYYGLYHKYDDKLEQFFINITILAMSFNELIN